MSQFENHYVGVRLRVKGTGFLRCKLYSMDDVYTDQLTNLQMQTALNTSPTLLANFRQERASLEIKTENLGERFEIHRILVFKKPVASGHPG